jgi:hypothetical protein
MITLMDGTMSLLLASNQFDNAQVIAWISTSLGRGAELSLALQQRLAELAHAFLVVPRGGHIPSPWIVDDGMREFPPGPRIQADFFRQANRVGLATIVIEDDLGLEGDPDLPPETAYRDGRLLHWTATLDAERAAHSVHLAASGYPFNSFMTDRAPHELGLESGRHLSSGDIRRLAASARVILTSAFDGVAYAGVATLDTWARLEGHDRARARRRD